MKNTYYPDKNSLVIEHNGRMIGFQGNIAERIFKGLLLKGEPVEIGNLSKPKQASQRSANICKN